MSYDAWKTTDPAIEAECPYCGADTRFEACAHTIEPDWESIVADREVA